MMTDETRFWAVVPVLATADVKATAEYYRDVPGFKIDDTTSGPD
ncbi:MAG: hypothetical protein QF828_17390 [Pseudomonadales bacterium]|jgi:catechol 2,3-dioxygenase-like lactoylglutathione lyase family enzyme|nr:hypothetical protein [Arenicellales bacterium]MDP7360180.1 hypothetical protein [Pseudomonadales bacterium]